MTGVSGWRGHSYTVSPSLCDPVCLCHYWDGSSADTYTQSFLPHRLCHKHLKPLFLPPELFINPLKRQRCPFSPERMKKKKTSVSHHLFCIQHIFEINIQQKQHHYHLKHVFIGDLCHHSSNNKPCGQSKGNIISMDWKMFTHSWK